MCSIFRPQRDVTWTTFSEGQTNCSWLREQTWFNRFPILSTRGYDVDLILRGANSSWLSEQTWFNRFHILSTEGCNIDHILTGTNKL